MNEHEGYVRSNKYSNGTENDRIDVIGELREICIARAREIYGRLLPPRIRGAIDEELSLAERSGVAVILLEAYKMLQLPCFKRDEYLNIGFKGALGSSFLAYLCGLSPINPGEISDPYSLYSMFYYALPETKLGQRSYAISLEVGQDTEQDFIKNFSGQGMPDGLMIRSTKDLTLLERLQREMGKVDMIREPQEREDWIIEASRQLGGNPCTLYYCAEDVYETLLVSRRSAWSELSLMVDNVMSGINEDIAEEERDKWYFDEDFSDFEVGDNETPEDSEEEDVYDLAQECREPVPIPCEEALEMSLRASIGQLGPVDFIRMREAGMSDSEIFGIKQITRLPFRAECIAKGLERMRLISYRSVCPKEYGRLAEQIGCL